MLSTAQKLRVARLLSRVVMAARRAARLPQEVTTNRGGVVWRLDLREGIDLSIYLFGAFEPATVRLYRRLVKPGHMVLDIGANIGAHTLPLAALVGDAGRVIAFEPTRYAIDKLKANLALNPVLSSRVTVQQAMLVARRGEPVAPAIYSSWPLDETEDLHDQHGGRLMDCRGAISTTLDDALDALGLECVDFVKLDVDGHEDQVLQGAAETIARFRPRILLELAPYVFANRPEAFAGLLRQLWDVGYELRAVASGRPLPHDADAVLAAIPEGGGINVLARPR